HRTSPQGSPRNVFPATITALEPRGDVVRVTAAGLAADLTPAAVADLALTPGDPVFLAVKAAEVDVHGVAATMGAWPNRASGPT
ncbi:MAG: TOBE domain-containing protein, partial [Actinomycetota bacterium]|nr:TOBE domain-containing protein [Actinomycetota bacterium]